MYLDTANLTDIQHYRDLGILKGITTNPTLLKQHPAPRAEQLAAILQTHPERLFVQVLGNDAATLVSDFAQILADFPNAPLGIKVPINTEGLRAVRQMRAQRRTGYPRRHRRLRLRRALCEPHGKQRH